MVNRIRKMQNAFQLPEIAGEGRFIIPEDMPILTIMISGNVVEATCIEHKPLDEVLKYVNRETKITGWITAVDYPRKEAGKYVWRFLQ